MRASGKRYNGREMELTPLRGDTLYPVDIGRNVEFE